MALNPNNVPNQYGWQAYTPSLAGSTDNPVATYTNQLGRFMAIQSMLFYALRITTSTMTKTTTSDTLQASLPIAAATQANMIWNGAGRVENGTAVANASESEVVSAAAVVNWRVMNIGTATALMTYAATAPGIGVLTNTINFVANGYYEF